MRARRRRRLGRGAVAAVLVAAATAGIVELRRGGQSALPPVCAATVNGTTYSLDLQQAANATTIAAIGKRLGLADHATTVALAAALQESGLHNLTYGDLDSVGLFQQRPSQGWGTTDQILVPSYAATAFFNRLTTVSGWQTMAVTDAAQAVQHSAAPSAYAQWEGEARVLAIALTGEQPASFACRFSRPGGPLLSTSLTDAMTTELGAPNIGAAVSTARGWTIASWLVGHAQQYRVNEVTFDGWRWTPSQQIWIADASAPAQVNLASA